MPFDSQKLSSRWSREILSQASASKMGCKSLLGKGVVLPNQALDPGLQGWPGDSPQSLLLQSPVCKPLSSSEPVLGSQRGRSKQALGSTVLLCPEGHH